MKVAVIARFANQLSVWGAMKSHIELIMNSGHEVIILVEDKCKEVVYQSGYKSITKTYESRRGLRVILTKGNYDAIWCGDIISVLLIKSLHPLSGTPIYFWVQGTLPDESYLRNGSRIRRFILRILERIAFRFSSGFVYVSETMKGFYEEKYCIKDKRSIVVPCLSDFDNFNPESVNKIPDSYIYIGGISEWQCFDEIVRIYKSIRTHNSIFHIITLDIEKAKAILEKYSLNENIKVYSLYDRTQIASTLAQFQYGFLIRKESPVNYVASPIKFLEYLSCNVNVIMSNAVPSYSRIVEKYRIGSVVEPNERKLKISPFNNKAREIYLRLFSREHYTVIYKELFEEN